MNKYINTMFKIYKCDYKNNDVCKKTCCICNNGECSHTTQYKYAKKNVLNYIKKIINKLRGVYKYE